MASASLTVHLEICPNFPLKCPNDCVEGTFPRHSLPAHLDKECPRQLVACTLKMYGCSKMVERSSLTEHVQSCLPQHAGDLLTQLQGLEREVQELRAMVSAQQEVLRAVESSVYPCAGQFTWRIDNIRSKIRMSEGGDVSSTAIYSPSFYSMEAGYKLSLCIYPAGDNNQGYVSLYFVIMRGRYDEVLQWPFQRRVYLSLLNTRCKSTLNS